MRRFVLFVVVSCSTALAVSALFPRQLGGYLALFRQHSAVNSGLAVTVVGVLTLLLAALRVRLWRLQRELARLRRELAQPMVPAYPTVPLVMAAYPPAPPGPWGSRPAR
jgi:hypothetical protein